MSVQLISPPSGSTRKNARSPSTPPADTSTWPGWCRASPFTGVIDSSDTDIRVPWPHPTPLVVVRETVPPRAPILADDDWAEVAPPWSQTSAHGGALREPDAVARRVAEARVDAVGLHVGLLGELDAPAEQLLVRLHRVVGGEEDRAREALGRQLAICGLWPASITGGPGSP